MQTTLGGRPRSPRDTTRRIRLSALALAPVLAASLGACGGANAGSDAGGGADGNALSGSVRVDGSSTVAPLTTAAAEFYQEEQSGVQVTVATSGTGGGFEKFCAGETDVSDASRPIEDEEKAACEKKGIAYEELAIANDALTVAVHKDNDWAECLTTEQLKKIWAPDSQVRNWNQVDPSFPDEPLKLFGPGTDSGTFDYFTDEINGAEGASRSDYTASEDDNVLVQGVAGSTGGLGYFGYSYFEENQDELRAVQIDNGDGCIAPSTKTVQDGSYTPLGRPLYIYPSATSLKKPQVMGFVEYYVRDHAQIAEDARFIPLSSEQETDLQTAFDKLKSSS